ncbi:MAG: sigma-54 dependent transcriptional regulator [Polyangiaceae bacterium]
MKEQPRLLVVDDQADLREALRLVLKRAKITPVEAASPAEALAILEREEVNAALVDMNYTRDTTSGEEGLALIAELHRREPNLPIVVMTAWGSVEGAVEAMRLGARDYVEKPWQNARLLTTLETQLALGRALEDGRRLRAERQHREASERPAMVAESRAMQEVLDLLQRVAPSDANVLVTGEHGTGKEVVARYLHAASTRHDEPFVVVHAGALADGVFESELFGHVRGAFTDAKADKPGCFALAHGGTLFLDEIGTMPLSQQAKLLRVLQSGELTPVGSTKVQRVDVRVVAATNVDVASAVERGDFREDLLYRLNTIEVRLPPLRDRRADIAPLAERFLARAPRPLRFSPDALEALAAHAWPGNVRELEHTVERAALLARSDCIEVEDLTLTPRRRNAERLDDMTLLEAEAHLIRRALERHGGQVVAAAKALGLSRSALYRRMSQHGIKAP